MAVHVNSLSVLVVNGDPEILTFFARILDTDGIRALLARNNNEAIGIAKRGYVPIDLVLTDLLLKPDDGTPELGSGPELVDRLRELRPEIRALYFSAYSDSEGIRIKLMDRGFETTSRSLDNRGLLESIRRAATAPLVHRMGGMPLQ
jgi:DNA-binding NtrC family response regulator